MLAAFILTVVGITGAVLAQPFERRTAHLTTITTTDTFGSPIYVQTTMTRVGTTTIGSVVETFTTAIPFSRINGEASTFTTTATWTGTMDGDYIVQGTSV